MKEDVAFLTRVTEEARREKTVRMLPYEVNAGIVFPWLERFAYDVETIVLLQTLNS